MKLFAFLLHINSERGYVTIEQGGVKSVRFTIVMNNNGNEEAIGNFLQITHSRPGVYSEKINLTIESVSLPSIIYYRGVIYYLLRI